MEELEYKSLGSFEMSDMSKDRRTAVIAHAVYDVVDRATPIPDISRKGMFTKTWTETKAKGYDKALGFFINHTPSLQPGLVKDVWEDEKKAYTKVSFGTHTLGEDTMKMMDEGIIRDASFSFKALRKNFLTINGKKVRELKEVAHGETSVVIGMPPINPLAGVVSVTKSADFNTIFSEFKAYVHRMETFCRNTTATDETIINIQNEIKTAKQFISSFDTAPTQVAPAPDASSDDNDREAYRKQLLLFNTQLSIR